MSDLVAPDHLLDDPKLAAAVARTVGVAKLAAVKAAAHLMDPAGFPLPNDAKSLERLFAARLASRPQASQQRAVHFAKKFLAGTPEQRKRHLGRLSTIDLRAATGVASQATALPLAPGVAAARAVAAASPVDASAGSHGKSAAHAGKGLEVRIHRVICSRTTDDGAWSDDEIKLGGLQVDADGHVSKVTTFKVHDNFVDPGDEDSDHVSQVKYDPPRRFCEWSFAKDADEWPRKYVAILILCEEDEGGFTDFLSGLMDGLVSVARPLLDGMFGALGEVISTILDGLFGWLKALWEDDPFHPISVHATLSSAKDLFDSGTTTSAVKKYWTTMGDGKYWIYFDWHVHS